MKSKPKHFKALLSIGSGKEENTYAVQSVDGAFLPDNEVLIRTTYSSLNYKDALCAKGHTGICRNYPQIPGIDASGIVVYDKTGRFKEGDQVLVTGYDLGMNTPGGFGEYICVPSDWVHFIPNGWNDKTAMMYGTAGFTAAIAIWKALKLGIEPGGLPLLVTGATGGVGIWAVRLASLFGFEVVASTGKMNMSEQLIQMGASKIIERNWVFEQSDKPLLKAEFGWTIDTVGGKTLETAIRMTDKEGVVAVCGNVTGNEYQSTVFPQILRGVSLLGIDSGHIERKSREEIWNMLAQKGTKTLPENWLKEVPLTNVADEIDLILSGKQTGRVVIKHELN